MDAEDDINLRVASFSYYLDAAKDNLVQRISAQDTIAISSGRTAPATAKPRFNTRENFVFKMPGPVQDPTTAFSFPQEPPYAMNFERNKSTDGHEIRVFGADKYFNVKSDYATELKISSHESENERPPQVRSDSRSENQSLYSETSSRNSQTALLQNVTRRLESEMKRKKAIGRRFFPVFGCQGPCIDKKAVHVSENSAGSKRVDDFAFPIPNPGAEKLYFKKQVEEEIKFDVPRESLEVFGSGTGTKGDIAKNLERKLSVLTWDAIPKGQKNHHPTSTIGSSTICDDLASDASSDLFEIENISGAVYPLLTETDNMSICTSPPTQYAPSEASIEWSVVTASAADYSSFISDYDENSVSVAGEYFISRNSTKKTSETKNIGGKETLKSRPGGLLGCKNHKAVDVAKTTYKTNEKAKHLGLDLSLSTGKSQAKNRVKDFLP